MCVSHLCWETRVQITMQHVCVCTAAVGTHVHTGASLPFIIFGSFQSSGVSPQSFPHDLGNRVTKAESYIPALCFQRSKCDCQVYKRLFMFSGVKWGAGARSRAGKAAPPG